MDLYRRYSEFYATYVYQQTEGLRVWHEVCDSGLNTRSPLVSCSQAYGWATVNIRLHAIGSAIGEWVTKSIIFRILGLSSNTRFYSIFQRLLRFFTSFVWMTFVVMVVVCILVYYAVKTYLALARYTEKKQPRARYTFEDSIANQPRLFETGQRMRRLKTGEMELVEL